MKDFEVKLKVPESKYPRWDNSYRDFTITIVKEDEVIFDDIRVNSDEYNVEKENEKEYSWSHKTPLEEFQDKKAVWYLDLSVIDDVDNNNRRYYISDINLGNMLKFNFLSKESFNQQIKDLVVKIKTEEEEKIKAEKIASYENNFFVKNKAIFEDHGWPVVSLEEYLKRTYTGIDLRKAIIHRGNKETFRIEIDGDYISVVRNYDNKKKTRKWDAERVIKNVNTVIDEWKKKVNNKIITEYNAEVNKNNIKDRFKNNFGLDLVDEREWVRSYNSRGGRGGDGYYVTNYYLNINNQKIKIKEMDEWNKEQEKRVFNGIYSFNGITVTVEKAKTLIDLLNS